MEDSLVVKEKYSDNWKTALFTSLIVALITFLLYLYIDNILWSGIFRLVAFMGLTLGIFCTLKVMEGAKTIEISIDKNLLTITYLKNDEVVGNDKLEIDKIKFIYSEPFQLNLPFFDYQFNLSDNHHLKIAFNDDDGGDISLFKFGGRVLSIGNQSEQQLRHFLNQHNLYS